MEKSSNFWPLLKCHGSDYFHFQKTCITTGAGGFSEEETDEMDLVTFAGTLSRKYDHGMLLQQQEIGTEQLKLKLRWLCYFVEARNACTGMAHTGIWVLKG